MVDDAWPAVRLKICIAQAVVALEVVTLVAEVSVVLDSECEDSLVYVGRNKHWVVSVIAELSGTQVDEISFVTENILSQNSRSNMAAVISGTDCEVSVTAEPSAQVESVVIETDDVVRLKDALCVVVQAYVLVELVRVVPVKTDRVDEIAVLTDEA